ncbi:recombination-associated protein RdgC [Xylophilus rhododendri]|uniref:Recombination-associated protein RdgC n=1 Tax=Xylophilus rhododendri TaxID=2697032 RepID=A0A857J757_9BURK|nr:recombination-associated protein RdgC [Xylophilus rhododendri]QHI98842.1 recombination-associated protein RdgC [Xylophilus rhododendri]
MFKNLIVYRITPPEGDALLKLEEGLDKARFAPCGASQERSAGWVEPRGEAHAPLVESIGGQWIMKFMVEAKVVPGTVVRRKLEERIAQIEKETGRKPGRKEAKELKEDVLLQLLPMAFTRQGATPVWLDPQDGWLVVGTSANARADEVVTALVDALPGITVVPLYTQQSAQAAMSDWLISQEPPAGFSVDRECELKASDESKAVVRYARHPLDIEEIRGHIEQGKLPTRLALTWQDRVAFVLTEGLQLKKITFLEGVFEGGGANKKEDGFDADAAISTGELGQLLPELLEALGGEMPAGGMPAALDGAPAATPTAAVTSSKVTPAEAQAPHSDDDAPF